MNRFGQALLIAFTYIGTIVGAGFASGQEILQFFTIYGRQATLTILLASLLFVWLGTKIMLIAREINAASYEDLNVHLFGPAAGRRISIAMLLLLLAVSSVMLAGAGAVFREHLGLSMQSGLIVTALLAYTVIAAGMNGIRAVNSVVVPVMLLFTVTIFVFTLQLPTSGQFLRIPGDTPLWRVWLSPFMYTAFNLVLAQAVLVPLGAAAPDAGTIRFGGLFGGIGITFLLLAGHISLAAQMPGIQQFEIPTGQIIAPLGQRVQLLFLFVVYAEIFTTLIADVYGLSLQLQQHTGLKRNTVAAIALLLCLAIGQIGFKTLLSTLYPLLGLVSLAWLAKIAMKQRSRPD